MEIIKGNVCDLMTFKNKYEKNNVNKSTCVD